jgi:hypothetical protein
MQRAMRSGVCGLLACTCCFCLSTFRTQAQEADIPDSADLMAGEDFIAPPEPGISLRQVLDQNLAVLKALDQLAQDREAVLARYTESVTTQLNALRDALTAQRQQDLETASRSNQFILTLSSAFAGIAILVMLVSAFLPALAMKRLTAAWPAHPTSALPLPVSHVGLSGLGSPAIPASRGDHSDAPLGVAIHQLEARLVALERRASHGSEDHAASNVTVHSSGAHARPAPAPASPYKSAQVAIALGQGEAITLLPREASRSRLQSVRAFLTNAKRVFKRRVI